MASKGKQVLGPYGKGDHRSGTEVQELEKKSRS